MNIKIDEKLGLNWQQQPVFIETELPVDLNLEQTSIYIDHEAVPSDLIIVGDKVCASFSMDLKSMAQKSITSGIRKNTETFLSFDTDTDFYIIKWLERTIKIPVSGLYEKGRVPGIIKSLEYKGEEYINDSILFNPFDEAIEMDTKIMFMGYQFCQIIVEYFKDSSSIYSAEISINGQFPEVNVSEKVIGKEGIGNKFSFSRKFTRARTRLHTPVIDNFKKDFWERVEFSPIEQEDVCLYLQPFYAWGKNCGSYLAAYSDSSVFNLVPVYAAKWKNGRKMRLKASFARDRLALETAGFQGENHWIISVIEKSKDYQEINPVKFTGGYNNYHYQIDKDLKGTYHAERLMAVRSGQSINKLFRDILFDRDSDKVSPGVLINRGEISSIGKKYENDDFIQGIAHSQSQSTLGADLAGVYLLNNDTDTAVQLAGNILDWFSTRIGMAFYLGYSTVHMECIALSRPLRDVAMDLDIICNSIDPLVKERLYNALSYLTCIISDRDYWPEKDNGFDMGNMNFHSDMYACLGVCACVLNGHVKSPAWIEYAVREFEKELKSSIYPGGAWAEAPTYHLASLSHLLVLATALKNSGYKNFFLQPELRETMLFLSYIQTPVDARCGFAMIPSLGDTTSNILTQSWQALFAWVARNTYKEQPEFSALMMKAWENGGSMRLPFSYNSGLKLALAMVDPGLPVAENKEYKSRLFPGFGAIMNKASGNDLSGYIALKAGEINNHYDHDEGTLIWYSNGVPVLIDYGTQYNPGVDQSFWHNRISIDHKSDWCRGEVLEFTTDERTDYVKMHVNINLVQEWPEYPDRDPEFNFRKLQDPYMIPEHSWTRELVYIKEIDSLLIMDDVKGSLPYDWNLHVLADDVVRHIGLITFRCMKNMRLDVHLMKEPTEETQLSEWEHLGLDETRIPIAWRDYSWMWEREISNMGEKTRILRIKRKPSSKFIALLSARKDSANPFKVSFNETGNVMNVETDCGKTYILDIKDGIRLEVQIRKDND